MNISRRQFIGKTALATAPVFFIPGISRGWNSAEPKYKIVDTPFGKLRGYTENGLNIFKGVPYAGSVAGEKRFQKAGSGSTVDWRARCVATGKSIHSATKSNVRNKRTKTCRRLSGAEHLDT